MHQLHEQSVFIYHYKELLIQLVQQSSNTINDASVYIGVKLAKLPNQIRDTVARDMIRIMK